MGTAVRALPYSESFDGQLTMTKEQGRGSVSLGDSTSFFRSVAHSVFLAGTVPVGSSFTSTEEPGVGLRIGYDHGVIGRETTTLKGTLFEPRSGECRIESKEGRVWQEYSIEAQGSLRSAVEGGAPYRVVVTTKDAKGTVLRREKFEFVAATNTQFEPVLGRLEAGLHVSDGRATTNEGGLSYLWPGSLPTVEAARQLTRSHLESNGSVSREKWALPLLGAGALILALPFLRKILRKMRRS
ncbi:MAG: hypothetical protein IT207_02985 [Fimbriimonadaceae bacterium]|nr:hypothetical protein [Fimbriimonadaceae bacterium]